MLFQVYLEKRLDWKTCFSYPLRVSKILSWIVSRYWLVFGPLALFDFIELIRPSTSSGTVGERKIVFIFRTKIWKMRFFTLTMFLFIFSAIFVKKLLKWLEIYLALVINWLSIRRLEIDSSDLFFMFIIPYMVYHTSFRVFLSLKYCL